MLYLRLAVSFCRAADAFVLIYLSVSESIRVCATALTNEKNTSSWLGCRENSEIIDRKVGTSLITSSCIDLSTSVNLEKD